MNKDSFILSQSLCPYYGVKKVHVFQLIPPIAAAVYAHATGSSLILAEIQALFATAASSFAGQAVIIPVIKNIRSQRYGLTKAGKFLRKAQIGAVLATAPLSLALGNHLTNRWIIPKQITKPAVALEATPPILSIPYSPEKPLTRTHHHGLHTRKPLSHIL